MDAIASQPVPACGGVRPVRGRRTPQSPASFTEHKGSEMDLTVIDDSDFTHFAGAAFTAGEVYMKSVADMVNNVLVASQWRKLEMLRIVDHGSTKKVKDEGGERHKTRCTLQFGDDKVNIGNFKQYEKQFQKLAYKFDENGFVHLGHCWAGRDKHLLWLFAKAFHVPVYAGTGRRAHWCRWQFGDLVVCHPDGKWKRGVEIP